MNKFKCKDEVIYRYADDYVWRYGVYSNYNKNTKNHFLLGDIISDDYQILPYKDNEHLVGTTDNPEEEITLEQGECVIVSDDIEELKKGIGKLLKYSNKGHYCIYANDSHFDKEYNYCIPFKYFNINNMKETNEHILCVKNWKLVRYGK